LQLTTTEMLQESFLEVVELPLARTGRVESMRRCEVAVP
jgi:hypothetical protein